MTEPGTIEAGETTALLSKEAALAIVKDPYRLPTREEIETAFPPGEELNNYLSLPSGLMKDQSTREPLTWEYVDALVDYLRDRVNEINKSKDERITILEVGAGNGRLSHFLRQQIEAKMPGQARVIATDVGKDGKESYFPVETLDYREALVKFQPQIVLCSWMPRGEDWSASFRSAPSVQEYILIGEQGGGCCGRDWETWGWGEPPEGQNNVPPYVADGFTEEYLEGISDLQIRSNGSASVTTSFKKV